MRPEIRQLPVGEHGAIGNLRTAALVASDGTIDWMCFPHFDSPSIFAGLLDTRRGGAFLVRPVDVESTRSRQQYIPETNVLTTRFWTRDATVEVTDFMPIPTDVEEDRHRLVRRIECLRGTVDMQAWCEPRFSYGRVAARASVTPGGVHLEGPETSIEVAGTVPLECDDGAAMATWHMRRQETVSFVLEAAGSDAHVAPPEDEECRDMLDRCVRFWRDWMSQCRYRGRWREIVHRSALVLKLLTYQPTGAMVAAPTTSLPTDIGGVRNWDYRYTWIRDSAFVLYSLMRLGFRHEAHRFMQWLQARCAESPELRPLYRIDGGTVDEEHHQDHLDGHLGSRPVRTGNLAGIQLQLDAYGALFDTIYLFDRHGIPIDRDLWNDVRRMADWLCANWTRADQGIWEVRSPAKDFTFSKISVWVALDRALRIAYKRGLPGDIDRWRTTRDAIGDWVYDNAWDAGVGAFVQYPGSDMLDAANVLMPMLHFASPIDPRVRATIDATRDRLGPDGLVHRYPEGNDDGLPGHDGSFSACSFWLVEAYTRQGKLNEARRHLEFLLSMANPLGLFAEQFTTQGEPLGNFPQAFTHLALISAATNLDRALDEDAGGVGHRPRTAWRAHEPPAP